MNTKISGGGYFGGGGGVDIGGGGGSGFQKPEKKDCYIILSPSSIDLTAEETVRLLEINNEDNKD
jgi:hypothetical protein